MKRYIIEYGVELGDNSGAVEHFACQADDAAHAIEQCIDAYPNATIIATFEERGTATDLAAALDAVSDDPMFEALSSETVEAVRAAITAAEAA